MKEFISKFSISKAALTVGIAFISSVIIVTLVDDFLLANFVIPGDTEALANDIAADRTTFGYAALGYLLVLALDTIIGIALYVVLRPANKNRALLTALFRVLYAFVLVLGILALAFRVIDAYDYASIKLFGYILFALHLLILGYSVFRSGYIPKVLGALLIVASFTYAVFFVDLDLPETLGLIVMSIMAIAELALSIWLIVKRKSLLVEPRGKALAFES